MYNHRIAAYTYLLVASIIWGIAGPVIKYTLQYFPPSIFLMYRFAVSTFAAVATFLVYPPRIPSKTSEWLNIGFYGFLVSTVTLGLLFIGFSKTSAIAGSVIGSISPIAIAIAGVLFLHEHVTKREKIGMIVAFAGTLITIIEPLWQNNDSQISSTFTGNLYHLASLAVGVVTAVQAKKLLRKHTSPLTLAHLSFIIGLLTMIPVVLTTHSIQQIINSITTAPLEGHLGVLYMGLLSGTASYALWYMGNKSIEIGETGLFTYLMPIFAQKRNS